MEIRKGMIRCHSNEKWYPISNFYCFFVDELITGNTYFIFSEDELITGNTYFIFGEHKNEGEIILSRDFDTREDAQHILDEAMKS